MKIIGKSIPFILLVCGALGFVGLKSLKQDPPTANAVEKSPLVQTARVLDCMDGFSLRVDGEVVPFREITLAAQVPGRIKMKSPQAKAGNYVQQGGLLFEIDPRDYELDARIARESVNQASSSIEEADIEQSNIERLIELASEELVLQNKDVKRFQQLKGKNATSTARVDTARRSEIQAENSVQTLRNQLLLVKARRNRLSQEKERSISSLDKALLNLSRTTIASPIEGVVIEDLAEQDDYLQPGSALVRLEDTSKAEVRFNLRMEQLQWLWGPRKTVSSARGVNTSYDIPRVEVRIHVDLDGHHFWWPGRLDRYDGAGISAATRTVPIIAIVDDPSNVQRLATKANASPLPAPPMLMRGAYVTVEIPVQPTFDLVRIPTMAIRPGSRVWVYDNGKLRIEKVQVTHAEDGTVILLGDPGGLAVGEEVIISPLPLAVDAMELRSETARTAREDGHSAEQEPTESL